MSVEIELNKKDLTSMFRVLRKEGFRVFLDYECCMTCALYGISKASPAHAPAVYYHKQDTQRMRDYGSLSLRYTTTGPHQEPKDLLVGIARKIAKAATQCNLRVEWDGSPGTVITLLPRDMPIEVAKELGSGFLERG